MASKPEKATFIVMGRVSDRENIVRSVLAHGEAEASEKFEKWLRISEDASDNAEVYIEHCTSLKLLNSLSYELMS